MKEDLLKFRKCCEILKTEKDYTNGNLCKELGISEPTLFKLMTMDINEAKGLRASTLGIIQDFLKKHCNDVNYAGIKPAPEDVQEMRKNLGNYDKKVEEKTSPIDYTIVPGKKKDPEIISQTEQTGNPFAALLEALNNVPKNITIVITINGSN